MLKEGIVECATGEVVTTYLAYLKTDHWCLIRRAALKRSGYTCESCGKSSDRLPLSVHHCTYDHIGNEDDVDLMVLCRDCHLQEHVDSDLSVTELFDKVKRTDNEYAISISRIALLTNKPISQIMTRFKQQDIDKKSIYQMARFIRDLEMEWYKPDLSQ